MKNLKIQRISCGYHHIMNGDKRVGTMERSEGGPTPGGAYEWFIDSPEVQERYRKQLSTHEIQTFWAIEESTQITLHTEPMPLTPEGVAAYITRSEESVSHHGNQWWVEVKPA